MRQRKFDMSRKLGCSSSDRCGGIDARLAYCSRTFRRYKIATGCLLVGFAAR